MCKTEQQVSGGDPKLVPPSAHSEVVREVSKKGCPMLCSRGDALLTAYRDAALSRSEARDVALLAGESRSLGNVPLLSARQHYNNALIAWMTHRGLCLICRSQAVEEDREQFKSM